MRISAFMTACGAAAVFASQLVCGAAVAQTTTDAAASQTAAPASRKAVRAENHQVSRAVRHALNTTKGLTASNIAIVVKGGVVSLVGTVPVESQIALAGDVAKRAAHADSIDNRLSVAEEGGGS
ncbi:hyperosmotically inducible protein [Paraburkholderia sp. GAS199]|uniref:BON domain-containing protein n=1 Tax=Paraburkholderia sp. GAS199 TaxID=3035126 RepID=UPI003D202E4F